MVWLTDRERKGVPLRFFQEEDIRTNCAVLLAKTEILERELKDAKSALLDSQKNAEMQYNKGLDKGAEISRSAR